MKDFELLRMPQIWAIAREERLRMLNALTREALTVTGVARKLDMQPNRAHYHVQKLLEHGLVEVVGTGQKRRREERFYRSVARNFLMDPELACSDGETSAALMRSAEAAFLDWRRKEILDIDLGEVAATVVNTCLDVQRGDTVLVVFGPHGLEFAEVCAVEIAARGALARTKLWSRNVVFRTLDRHESGELEQLPFIDPELDDAIDVVLLISTHMPQGSPPNATQRAKMPILLEAVSRWQRRTRERNVRYLEVDLPHRGDFVTDDMAPEAAIDLYWRCIRTDYDRLARRAGALAARLGEAGSVELVCPRGTDLRLTLDTGSFHINDGVISSGDLDQGRCFDVLPAGSLAVLPVLGDASGVWVADYTFAGGRHFWNARLTIHEGRITSIDCDSGSETLRRALEHAAGDADVLASVTFGVNPAGSGPTGMPVLDGCLDGCVTLSFGNNELLGGEVRATLDLACPSHVATARSGRHALITEGKLTT